ncbi:conserved protein of unknown function [Nitrospira japonica]|uniref:Uncharacterized protein n=1 Tax=Nitrospira japonica TaxID=1325564 RepID=A0A1W1I4B6_9BACT|nr:hypothetical protein [Nitrospira japonica]SLM47867.1 conserved protein of unknown function [Nitrospira japonica]
MAEVFHSGAFLQQCWSVHPLCIAVKRMGADRTLILSCSSCRSVHHLALGSVTVRASVVSADPQDPERPGDPDEGEVRLTECLRAHAAALSLRDMDVFKDLVLIRCAECRRHYAVAVTAFETHQK